MCRDWSLWRGLPVFDDSEDCEELDQTRRRSCGRFCKLCRAREVLERIASAFFISTRTVSHRESSRGIHAANGRDRRLITLFTVYSSADGVRRFLAGRSRTAFEPPESRARPEHCQSCVYGSPCGETISLFRCVRRVVRTIVARKPNCMRKKFFKMTTLSLSSKKFDIQPNQHQFAWTLSISLQSFCNLEMSPNRPQWWDSQCVCHSRFATSKSASCLLRSYRC